MRNRSRRPRSMPRTGRGSALQVRPQLVTLEDRTLMSVDLWSAFPGLTTSAAPPDTTGAAGPDYVLEAINLSAAWYDKSTGSSIFTRTLSSLFNSAGLTGVLSLSDPVTMYDEFTGQWVIGALDYRTSSPEQSRFDLAISYDEDPRDGFYGQRYDMDDGTGGFDFADYPKAGYNQEAYVFSFNMFPNLGSFNHVNTLAVDKSDLTGYRVQVPGGAGNFTLAPAVMHNANPGDPMWLVETGSGSTRIRVVEMTDILTDTPTFQTFSITVPAYGTMPSPAQPNGSGIVTFDTLMINASYNNGLLVAGHSIGAGGLAQARWYEIDLVDYDTPTLVQVGNVDQGPGVHTFFPSLDINDEGDIGMTFMESSSSEFLSMYVTGQSIYNGYYGTGVMEPPAEALAGTARYTSSRIGDYSGTSLDPADRYSFWSFNQYARTNGTTAVAYFSVDPDGDGSAPGLRGRRVLPALSADVAEPEAAQLAAPLTGLAPLALAVPTVHVVALSYDTTEKAPAAPLASRPPGAEEAGQPKGQENASVETAPPAAAPTAATPSGVLLGDVGFEDLLDL